jgi:disulfide bond formation protein DsbB
MNILAAIGLAVWCFAWRARFPGAFDYGGLFLSAGAGAWAGILLLVGSAGMVAAAGAARRNDRWRLLGALSLAAACGVTFLTVRGLEVTPAVERQFAIGLSLRAVEEPDAAPQGEARPAQKAAPAQAAFVADAKQGQALWMATCRSCHGPGGEGITGQGKDIRGSEFIAGKTDRELVAFIKVGRMPFDPLNTTGIQMPPRGGNPLLKDDDLAHIVAYVRSFKAAGGAADGGVTAAPGAAAPIEEFYMPISVIPSAPPGPAGLARDWRVRLASSPPAAARRWVDPRRDPVRPPNTHLFFAAWGIAGGIHAAQVGLVLLLIAALATVAAFAAAAPAPRWVSLSALLWHMVTVAWLLMLLAFYPR